MWRRRLLHAAYWVGGAAVAVVCLVLAANSLQDIDSYGSIVSTLIALGTAFTGIVVWLRAGQRTPKADEVEEELVAVLRAHWEQELLNRRTSRSGERRTIPLTWEKAASALGAAPRDVVGGHPGGKVRLKLSGRLDTDPDVAANDLAELFGQLPGDKRLVILGEPGAGKTFLAVTLAVGLLRGWAPGRRVAVFLSLASWDPIVEDLDRWMAREIASLYLGGRVALAEDLLLRRRVLPVLDGLDELPEHARRLAVTRVNRTLDGDRQIVLTCRETEYEDEIAGGAPVLLGAGVVRVHPLGVDDILDYLDADPEWAALRSFVADHRDSPLAEALSTPLMLSLFGSVYGGRSPDRLMAEPLATRHEVEDYLVDQLLDTAYPATAARPGGWTSAKARRWLTHLAKYLHEKKARDLSPWQLVADRMGKSFAVMTATVPVFLYLALVNRDVAVLTAMLCVVGAAAIIAANRRVPGRGAFDETHRAETFRFGMAVGTTSLVAGGLLIAVLILLLGQPTVYDVATATAAVTALTAAGLITGLGFGLNELMAAAVVARGTAKVGGRDFLARDRASSLGAAAMSTVFVGAATLPCVNLAAAFGYYLGQRVAVAVGMDAVVDTRLSMAGAALPDYVFPLTGRELVTASAWYAVVFACALLGTRTWAWLLVLRATHAPARALPWRLMAFLDDARGRGLFRGAGGYYQFGHVRLQERLVATAAKERNRTTFRKVRLVAAALVAVLLASGVVWTWAKSPDACRRLGWSGLDARMRTVVRDGEVGCFVALRDEDWDVLDGMSADPTRIALLKNAQPDEDKSHDTLVVVGELDRLSVARWDVLLTAIDAGKEASDRPIRVLFVHADLNRVRDPDAALLTADFVRSISQVDAPVSAVHTDLDVTWLPMTGHGEIPVIGMNDDVESLLQRQGEKDVQEWVDANTSALSSRTLTDGVSAGECRALEEEDVSVPGNFDLRGAEEVIPVLEAIVPCAPANVLVDYTATSVLGEVKRKLKPAGVVPKVGIAETLRPDCEAALVPSDRPDAMAACIAVAAATWLRGELVADVILD